MRDIRPGRVRAAGRAFAVALLAAAACGRGGPDLEQIPVGVSRVADGVITVTSLDVSVGAVETAKGIVVIDTGRSPTLMKAARKAIEAEFGRSDFAYVVNTHAHADHTSGNQVFPASMIVGHRNCPDHIRWYPADSPGGIADPKRRLRDLREKIAALDASADEALELKGTERSLLALLGDLEHGYRPTPPQRTFADRLRLDLGNVTLDLIYAGRSHSESDILVYVPERKVLFTGDLVCGETRVCFSLNAMVDAERLIWSLDQVLQSPSGLERVVTGHAGTLTRNQLAGLLDILRAAYRDPESRASAARFLERKIDEEGFEKALKEFHESREAGTDLGPVSEVEFDILASRLVGRGMAREAVEVLRAGLEILPQSSLLYDGLGGAYLRIGEKDLAAISYQRSLDLNPYNRNAADLLEVIRGAGRSD